MYAIRNVYTSLFPLLTAFKLQRQSAFSQGSENPKPSAISRRRTNSDTHTQTLKMRSQSTELTDSLPWLCIYSNGYNSSLMHFRSKVPSECTYIVSIFECARLYLLVERKMQRPPMTIHQYVWLREMLQHNKINF